MKSQKNEITIFLRDEKTTEHIATVLAAVLSGQSACIELAGDVGTGKTTFMKYFVSALGSKDKVSSPTFTLQNIYHADDNTVYHFDLYRLQDAGLMPQEVHEALEGEKAIVAIEWADILQSNSPLPDNRISLHFSYVVDSDKSRTLTISSENNELLSQIEEELEK